MRDKAVLMGGGGLSIALSILMITAVGAQQWVLAAVAVAVLLSTGLLVAIDAWRRARSLRHFIRVELRRATAVSPAVQGDPTDSSPEVTTEDIVGAVAVLNAQYTGRLDRMQSALDEALRELRLATTTAPTDRSIAESGEPGSS